MTTLPVAAQSEPESSFRLELGTGGAELQVGGQSSQPSVSSSGRGEAYQIDACLGDRDIRRGLRDDGYSDIDIRRNLGSEGAEVYATYSGAIYKMQVDRCTGEVSRIERVRRAGGGGFGLHFDYGNGY